MKKQWRRLLSIWEKMGTVVRGGEGGRALESKEEEEEEEEAAAKAHS